MKKIYVVGSFKDRESSLIIFGKIKEAGFEALISNPGDPDGIDGCLRRVDVADIIYVNNPRNEIGKSVSVDIGYSIAKQKEIYSANLINDPPIGHLTKKTISIEALLASLP